MKALVLQMRGVSDSSRAMEQQEYLHYTGLLSDQIDFVDLYEEPAFQPQRLLAYDLLFIGGISRDKAEELTWPKQRFPFIHHLHDIMRLAIEQQVPALLSCGGFATGGTIFRCVPAIQRMSGMVITMRPSAPSVIFRPIRLRRRGY